MLFLSHLQRSKIQCPFCTIKKETTKIISSRPFTRVVFSNPRLVPGHLLVIPKRHVEKLSELTQKELIELWNTTIDFQERIISRIAPGCDIRQNYHPFQKQGRLKVDHLHLHLIPRAFKDPIYKMTQINEKYLFEDLEEKEMERILKILKKPPNIKQRNHGRK